MSIDQYILKHNHKYESELSVLKNKINADECFFRNDNLVQDTNLSLFATRDGYSFLLSVNEEVLDNEKFWTDVAGKIDQELNILEGNYPTKDI